MLRPRIRSRYPFSLEERESRSCGAMCHRVLWMEGRGEGGGARVGWNCGEVSGNRPESPESSSEKLFLGSVRWNETNKSRGRRRRGREGGWQVAKKKIRQESWRMANNQRRFQSEWGFALEDSGVTSEQIQSRSLSVFWSIPGRRGEGQGGGAAFRRRRIWARFGAVPEQF